jgi:hypothetical protein
MIKKKNAYYELEKFAQQYVKLFHGTSGTCRIHVKEESKEQDIVMILKDELSFIKMKQVRNAVILLFKIFKEIGIAYK